MNDSKPIRFTIGIIVLSFGACGVPQSKKGSTETLSTNVTGNYDQEYGTLQCQPTNRNNPNTIQPALDTKPDPLIAPVFRFTTEEERVAQLAKCTSECQSIASSHGCCKLGDPENWTVEKDFVRYLPSISRTAYYCLSNFERDLGVNPVYQKCYRNKLKSGEYVALDPDSDILDVTDQAKSYLDRAIKLAADIVNDIRDAAPSKLSELCKELDNGCLVTPRRDLLPPHLKDAHEISTLENFGQFMVAGRRQPEDGRIYCVRGTKAQVGTQSAVFQDPATVYVEEKKCLISDIRRHSFLDDCVQNVTTSAKNGSYRCCQAEFELSRLNDKYTTVFPSNTAFDSPGSAYSFAIPKDCPKVIRDAFCPAGKGRLDAGGKTDTAESCKATVATKAYRDCDEAFARGYNCDYCISESTAEFLVAEQLLVDFDGKPISLPGRLSANYVKCLNIQKISSNINTCKTILSSRNDIRAKDTSNNDAPASPWGSPSVSCSTPDETYDTPYPNEGLCRELCAKDDKSRCCAKAKLTATEIDNEVPDRWYCI